MKTFTKKIIRKRLLGVLVILLIRALFIASSEEDCIYIVENKMDGEYLRELIISGLDSLDEKTSSELKTKPATPKKAENTINLSERYKRLGYKNQHPFIKSFISDNMPTVKKYSKLHGILPSISMAIFINECVIPNENRVTDLAAKYFNYGSLKQKGENDIYLSENFKAILNRNLKSTVKYYDDDYIIDAKGKRTKIQSEFYSFKSNEAGLETCIAFIADRVKSKHPNYVGKFDGYEKFDVYQWAYAIYDAGYANKNTLNPLDQKLIRIINTYNLKQYD